MKAPLLTALTMLCGCGYDVNVNGNSGSAGQLGFEGAAGLRPLLGSFTVAVSHQPQGRFHCTPTVQMYQSNGDRCVPVDFPAPVAELVSAGCASDLCSARIEPITTAGAAPVRIVAHGTGKTELKVSAELGDGTLREDSISLEFQDIAHVTCDDAAGCFRADSIPEGDTTTWRVQCLAPECFGPGAIGVTPPGVVEVSDVMGTYDAKTQSRAVSLRATHAGVADLAFTAGQGNWVHLQVRVVAAGQTVPTVAHGAPVPSFVP
jgi:hypothetical protein